MMPYKPVDGRSPNTWTKQELEELLIPALTLIARRNSVRFNNATTLNLDRIPLDQVHSSGEYIFDAKEKSFEARLDALRAELEEQQTGYSDCVSEADDRPPGGESVGSVGSVSSPKGDFLQSVRPIQQESTPQRPSSSTTSSDSTERDQVIRLDSVRSKTGFTRNSVGKGNLIDIGPCITQSDPSASSQRQIPATPTLESILASEIFSKKDPYTKEDVTEMLSARSSIRREIPRHQYATLSREESSSDARRATAPRAGDAYPDNYSFKSRKREPVRRSLRKYRD
jgi:hypothetical protein